MVYGFSSDVMTVFGLRKRSGRGARQKKADPPKVNFDPYAVDLGEEFPDVVPAFIEVAKDSKDKFEWNGKKGALELDRVLSSDDGYPFSYGFVPKTLCGDGDPLDILVMGDRLEPGTLVYVRPIAYLMMTDEKGQDEKVLGVRVDDEENDGIRSMSDVPKEVLDKVSHFFATYKAKEPGKWVKIGDWYGTEDTLALMRDTHEAHNSKAKKMLA